MALNLFELAAKITLDKSDFDKGLRGGETSMQRFGANVNKVFKGATVAITTAASVGGAAFVKLTKNAFKAAASYEQLLGGVETLFKESSHKVEQYAAVAYRTAGMSANEYMDTVTSFSASLLQSLGGDTSKAADVADMAIQDMSDNANKMGTNMESIEAAYQGFAKQNYTLLDNLKLGYGGTKTEMERLLADASKLTGKKYNLNNLADVYEAIHAIQKEMGITGATADEASRTIEGSWKAVSAAFQNFLSGNGGAEGGYQALVSTLDTALNLSVDRLSRIVPRLAQQGGEIFKKLGDKIPALMEVLMPAIETGMGALLEGLGDVLPYLITSAANLLPSLVKGMTKLITNLAAKMPQILGSIWTAIKGVFAKLGESDNPVLKAIAGVFTAISNTVSTITDKESALGQVFETLKSKMSGIVTSALETIQSVLQWIADPANADKVKAAVEVMVAAFATFEIVKIASNINPIGLAISAIAAAVLLIIENWDTLKANFEAGKQKVIDIWNDIKTAVTDAWTAVSNWVDANVLQTIQTAWSGVTEFFTELWTTVSTGVSDAWNEVTGTVDTVIATVKLSWLGIIGWFKQQVIDKVKSKWDDITAKVKEVITEVENAWNAIVTWFQSTIIDPISEAWEDFKKTFTGWIPGTKKATLEVDTVYKNAGTVWVDPETGAYGPAPSAVWEDPETGAYGPTLPPTSNAKGLGYVPYDNYVTRLHRGEMVLNKSRADDYRNGSGSMNLGGLTAAIAAAVREGMSGASVNAYIDGRDITDEVSRRQAAEVYNRRFAAV